MKKIQIVFFLLLLLFGCTKTEVTPVQPTTTTNELKITNNLVQLQGTWTGTDIHYYYGAYDKTYNVEVTISNNSFTIKYVDPNLIPSNRYNPNVWQYSTIDSGNQTLPEIGLKISATYILNVAFVSNNQIVVISNNGDEVFNLTRK